MIKNNKFDAVIFDLDGVITQTAKVHSRAWKKMFDEFLKSWSEKNKGVFKEFSAKDYLDFVDGKPRYDGVQSFLQSREINLEFGSPDDSFETETVCGLGNRKNIAFNQILQNEGVEVFPSTVSLMEELKRNNIQIGVASSSKNCESVLQAAGLEHFVETRVDGVVSAQLGLKGKPAPDIFIQAAQNLNVTVDKAVVIEDASSGVEAGKNGNFGLVIGLARENNHRELWAKGADVVVDDLQSFGFESIDQWFIEGIEESNWSLTYHDYIPEKEKTRETLLSLGNGFFGSRGCLPFSKANDFHYPGTYVAGLYNRLTSKVGDRNIENEDFVNCPNTHFLRFKIEDGQWMNIDQVNILSIRRTLYFKNGLLSIELTTEDPHGNRTLFKVRKFASMDHPHLSSEQILITPLNYTGQITVESGIDGDIINDGVARYRQLNQQHISVLENGSVDNVIYLQSETTQSAIQIVQAVKHQVQSNEAQIMHTEKAIYQQFIFQGIEAEEIRIQKTTSIFTSHSFNTSNPKEKAIAEAAKNHSFDSLLEKSGQSWQKLWDEMDIQIEGDRLAQKLLRLHMYHLLISLSPHNPHLDASITARGLHGEAYRGHIFWDELFILPFYNLHFPEISKAALLYRYRRLEEARKYANEFGYQGAMFPWQSGSSGREETQVLHLNPVSGHWGHDFSSLQRHVSLAIAYNIWQYFHITQDQEFIEEYGVEIFFEICRFWASKAHLQDNQRYSIDEVMGPDEFHEQYEGAEKGGLKDNAYTNLMVAWSMDRAMDLLNLLSEEKKHHLMLKIGLKESEIEHWKAISSGLNLVIEDDIISQYDGYFDLKELDWDYYREKYGNIYRMDRILKSEGKSADVFKVAKQADTLQTFYNLNEEDVTRLLNHLGYSLADNYLSKNLQYYLQRTSHGSTLSRVVHAQLANMISDKKLSWELYQDALTSDYADIQGGTTGEGIHAGVMAGTILIALQSFAGINVKGEILEFKPFLPDHWKSLTTQFTFQGTSLRVSITNNDLLIETDQDIIVSIFGKKFKLFKGQKDTFAYERSKKPL